MSCIVAPNPSADITSISRAIPVGAHCLALSCTVLNIRCVVFCGYERRQFGDARGGVLEPQLGVDALGDPRVAVPQHLAGELHRRTGANEQRRARRAQRMEVERAPLVVDRLHASEASV